METAINIGYARQTLSAKSDVNYDVLTSFILYVKSCSYACSLLRQGMKQIIINSETSENEAFEKSGESSAAAEVLEIPPLRTHTLKLFAENCMDCINRYYLKFDSVSLYHVMANIKLDCHVQT